MLRRILAILAFAVLLVGVGTPRGLAYLCSMTGEVRQACCCAKDAPAGPAIEERNTCCQTIDAPTELVFARAGVEAFALDAPIAIAPAGWSPIAPPLRSLPDLGARDGPPPDEGPLFVQHCVFLI